jgi:hypothetical protein
MKSDVTDLLKKSSHMQTVINSVECVQQLKKGDIIYHCQKNENYLVTEVCDGFLLISDYDEPRALKIINFSDLLQGKWEIKSEIFN